MLIAISACKNNSAQTAKAEAIYLYGEEHGREADTKKSSLFGKTIMTKKE